MRVDMNERCVNIGAILIKLFSFVPLKSPGKVSQIHSNFWAQITYCVMYSLEILNVIE